MFSLTAATVALTFLASINAQDTTPASTAASASSTGYVGYNLTLESGDDSVIYSTDETNPNAGSLYPNPDVFLNASVDVGEIKILVDNLTAKINLDLQVLKLLTFNAGVEVNIDRVNLLIQNVSAKVLLEARLENILTMVNDTLASIDLNPVIATLGQDVGSVVNNTVGGLTGTTSGASSANAKRSSFDLEQNILFSVNNYAGDTHTNRVLAQNGDIVEQDLDNDGTVSGSRVVGSYKADMTYNGHEESLVRHGELVQSMRYTYAPIHGVSIVANVYLDESGSVVGTQVLSEVEAGGSSTIADL